MSNVINLADRYQARNQQPAVLQNQFSQPHGILGRIVGWIMARGNARLNHFAVRTLDVKAEDEVLEVGFGPGHAIGLLVDHSSAAFIAGADPSTEMVAEACARNQAAIDVGRVALLQGTADELPFNAARFTRVLAVSNFLIWDSPEAGLVEIRRVLRPGGRLVICLRRAPRVPRWWKSPGANADEINQARHMLSSVGFHEVKLVKRRRGCRAVCLMARR